MSEADLPERVTMPDIAGDLGLPLDTIHTYKTRSDRHRRQGRPRRGDLPEPDASLGRTPGWWRETYLRWKENRPGRGAGGGPKPQRSL